jgi:hypothetical protein
VLLAALATLVLTVTVPRPRASAAVSTAPQGVLFGAAVGVRNGQSAGQAIGALEARLGRTLDLHRTYWRWDDAQPTSVVQDDVRHDRIPLISILAKRKDGVAVPWASIGAGDQDAAIGRQADGLRALGSRVILIFHHEADIAVGYGTPADYVAAFRRIVSVFRAHGAANVEFATAFVGTTFAGTTFSGTTFSGTTASSTAAQWYPGDDVVDWIGADIYNFGSCVPGQSPWGVRARAGL